MQGATSFFLYNRADNIFLGILYSSEPNFAIKTAPSYDSTITLPAELVACGTLSVEETL